MAEKRASRGTSAGAGTAEAVPDAVAAAGSSPAAAPEEVAEKLHSAAIHLLRRLRRQDVASGLTAPRLSALSVIVYAGPLTLGALAAAEQVRPPTITRIVAALEQEGLVERAPGEDRRVTLVRATHAGARLLHEGRRRRTAQLAPQLAALSPKDRRTLSRAAALLEGLI